jgi:hypothetical protein
MTTRSLLTPPPAALRRLAAVTAAAAMLALAWPATVAAQPDGAESGRAFGQHVAGHSDDMRFDGEHNPGMHRGFAGWPGHHPGE